VRLTSWMIVPPQSSQRVEVAAANPAGAPHMRRSCITAPVCVRLRGLQGLWPIFLADNQEGMMMVLTVTRCDDTLGLLLQRVDVLLVEH
jgi:hypothetical protein